VTIYLSTLNLQQVCGLDPLSGRLAEVSARPCHGYRLHGLRVVVAALAASGRWVAYAIALSACGFTLALVYAFTTVATQAVVRPERAGEAAGVTLTSLVTLAGVGVAVSGTMLEMLRQSEVSEGGEIYVILGALAAALLPAGVWLTTITRSRTSE
jgi:hypothetical protein